MQTMPGEDAAQTGKCRLCGDDNPLTMLACIGCGARLPWADTLLAAPRPAAAPALAATAAVAAPALAATQPAAPAPRLRGSAFGYDPNEKVAQGTLNSTSGERAVANIYFTWLVPIGGVLLIALMFYLLYMKAIFGVGGKYGLILPLGFMVRIVLNQLFDD